MPPLSVGVTLDLHRGPQAGGHVKCWERFAAAALEVPEALDLTVYTLGEAEAVEDFGPSVRFHALVPRFGTERLRFLNQGAGETDLAHRHPRAAALMARHDVLHHTHAFALSRTAVAVARKRGIPLTASVHTDLPAFTRHYSRTILRRSAAGRLLLDRFAVDERLAVWQDRRMARLLRPCRKVLVSREADWQRYARVVGAENLSPLRRGIDIRAFGPECRDRGWLEERFGIARDIPVLLFVGRVDESKRVLTLARAVRHLLDAGRRVRVLVLGEGDAAAAVRDLLGEAAVLPGRLHGEDLARAYASGDLFVFPSDTDVFGNVVFEARASGTPAMVEANSRILGRLGDDTSDLAVAGQDPQAWADAIGKLLDDPERLQALGRADAERLRAQAPSWRTVLEEDLLAVWQQVTAEASRS